jgi:tRNA(Ile)-lysidine synthetase-like protein
MSQSMLESAIGKVPAGRWAVAVSGGADSVAALSLLRGRGEVQLHVVHLDHELRGAESEADARFVADLAGQFGIPFTIGRRHEVEARMRLREPLLKNLSARYRAARLDLFRAVVLENALDGVILAHHADDQAETVLQRLLRGSGWPGLCGMRERRSIGGLVILRPMLGVPRAALRTYLQEIGQPWREDSSNVSQKYLRNRLRRLLAERADLSQELLQLAESCRLLRRWARQRAPRLPATFAVDELADLPGLVARTAAAHWLTERGGERAGGAPPRNVELLLEMARDAATPSRQQMAGGITVVRRRGSISVNPIPS